MVKLITIILLANLPALAVVLALALLMPQVTPGEAINLIGEGGGWAALLLFFYYKTKTDKAYQQEIKDLQREIREIHKTQSEKYEQTISELTAALEGRSAA